MTLAKSVILALLQGVTEFLPVSSSGHLVIAESLMKVKAEGVLWEVALHLGTLAAVLIVFRKDIWEVITGFCSGMFALLRGAKWRAVWRERPGFRMAWYVVIGTIPAGIAGVALKHRIEAVFSSPIATCALIFCTGEILWLSRPCNQLRPEGNLHLWDSIRVGLAQALALLPGVSRSGTTITAGILCGVDRDRAARFSFLLSVPAILGAAVLEGRKLPSLPAGEMTPLLVGISVACAAGYLALRLLLRVVRAGRLHWFAYYCWIVSVLGVAYFWAQAGTRYWR
jgi:undecaprenyl-diphosphatase